MRRDQRGKIAAAVILVMLLITMALLTGCRPQENNSPPAQVTVQLRWVHQAQFVGFYTADQMGFYTEENIDVNLIPGGPDTPPDRIVADLVSGETDFAILSGAQLLEARDQGEPIVAIAVVFQKDPYVYASLKDSGIERPQDLVGKKVMVPADGEVQHNALLGKMDIDPSTIEMIPYQRDVTPLTSGQIDAMMVYRTGGLGLAFDEAGTELNWIWMDNYGIHLIADTLVASETLIQQNPDLVERFLRATLQGWQYAIENQDQGVEFTLHYDPALSKDLQKWMIEVQTPLIHTGEVKIGWMDRELWVQTYNILKEAGVIEKEIDIDKVFTMQFLEEIASQKE